MGFDPVEWDLGRVEEADKRCRNKIVFISWSPDEGTLVFVRFLHASKAIVGADDGLTAENDLCLVEGGFEECTPGSGP